EEQGRTVPRVHARLDELSAAAPEMFYRHLADTASGWAAREVIRARAGERPTETPPVELIAWHLLADDGLSLAERLRECFQKAAQDGRFGSLSNRDEAEIETEIKAETERLGPAREAEGKAKQATA